MSTYKQSPKDENRVTVMNVRLSYEHLFERYEDKFSGSFILDPTEHADAIKYLKGMMVRVAKAKWKDKGEKMAQALASEGKTFLRNGDSKDDEAYAGKMFFSASNSRQPRVIDKHRVGGEAVVLTKEDGKPYSGCYVNVTIDIWAQDNDYGKRINASLAGVQFWADGEPLSAGGRTADDDDFEFAEEEDAELAFL